MLVALAFGALFNAPAMKKTALEQPFGAERTLPSRARRPAGDGEPLAVPRPAGEVHGRRARQARPGSLRRRRRSWSSCRRPPTASRARATSRQVAAGAPAAQAVQGPPDAPVHRRRLDDGPARHGAHQPVQQDEADQAHARLPHLDRPGPARLLQLAGAAAVAGQGVRPGRRGRHVRRQRQPAAPDVLRQDLPVRHATAGRRSTASASRTSSACCSRAACAACTGSASRSCPSRRSTARSS